MTELLEVEGLCAGYGAAPVLHDVDLLLAPGKITAVLGANGAGKTTLLRTVSGLVRLGGRIGFAGANLRRTGRAAGPPGLAHVPEGRGVIGELTVHENLRLGGLWRAGADGRRETDVAIAEVYDLFEPLARRRSYHGHQLSGGERQMLALGRALVARPRLLLLDEPSLGLAPVVAASIMSLLRTLRDKTGLTVLLVEQNVRSALAIADDGVVVAGPNVAAAAAQLQATTTYGMPTSDSEGF